jgi:predicted CoA-binding protein
VSRTPKTHGSNNVYRRLRERGYQVFAVNPYTSQVEGDRCYRDLASIPGGVEAAVIGTRPELAEDSMRESRRRRSTRREEEVMAYLEVIARAKVRPGQLEG